MSTTAVPVPPKKLINDDSENEDPEVNLVEDLEVSDEDDDESASKQSSENDETGSQTTDDDSASSAIDDENEGGGGGDSGQEDSDTDVAVGVSVSKMKKSKKKPKKDAEDDLTLLGVPHGLQYDEDEGERSDEDDDEDADRDSSEYFQKLASTVSESYIETYHPETMSHNYDEIQTLSRVVRNSAGVIVDDLHRTIPIMTKYEKTRVLGQRTKQLNEGAPAFIKIDSTVIDGYLIAVKELEQKKTPFIIRRPLPNGGSEYWRIQDLEIL
jgi:DNA-directed RNA polymerase I, II, and III subunit RPABC2